MATEAINPISITSCATSVYPSKRCSSKRIPVIISTIEPKESNGATSYLFNPIDFSF